MDKKEREELKAAHKHCFANKESIAASDTCGCFYCLKTFPASETREWFRRVETETARCPYCGIDSVLPSSVCNIDPAFLQRMHDYWFKRGIKFTAEEWAEAVRTNKLPPRVRRWRRR
jgi:hypothetical protein